MDNQENADQVMQKLSSIESQLRSLRYTFGVGIIILAVFLTLLVPTLMRDFPYQSGGDSSDQTVLPPVAPPTTDTEISTSTPEADTEAAATTTP